MRYYLQNLHMSRFGRGRLLILCAGNGAIPLFLSARTNAHIIAVELQERLANMAERSVRYNELENQIQIVNDDVIGIASKIGL